MSSKAARDAWPGNPPLASPIGVTRLGLIYSRTAAFYDGLVGEHQARAKLTGLDVLALRPGERLLELGVGTGWACSKLLARGADAGSMVGVDVASGMLQLAHETLHSQGRGALPGLALADALALPFPHQSFDCAFSSYTLEVMPTESIAPALLELLRLLRPGGRLVLVNLTEGEGDDVATIEDWKARFQRDPEYFGGARPLVLAPLLSSLAFEDVSRVYVGREWPSEVLLARAPGR